MLTTIFIPGIKVNALTGNDGSKYPDVPTKYGSAYLIYKDNNRSVKLVVYPSKYITDGDTVELFISANSIMFGSPSNNNRSVYLYNLSSDGNSWDYKGLDAWGAAYDYTEELTSTEIASDPSKLKSLLSRVILSSSVNYSRGGVIVYSKNEIHLLDITNTLFNDTENDRSYYLVDFDLGEHYDSKYKLYYGNDVNNQTEYTAEFNQETKKATIKHAFDSVPIYYQLIENDDLSNPVLKGVYSVPIGYITNNNKISIKELNDYDHNGNKIIKTTLDFSNIEKFRDIHPNITYMINSNIVNDINYNWIITNDTYNSFETKYIRVFLGQYSVINEGYYHPKWEGGFTKKPGETPTIPNFDDKYTNVVEKELLEKVDMNDLDNGPGIVKMVKAFVGAIKDFIISFFKIIINFFNKLNIWIRACIISLFCIFIISRIIKAVRK